LTSCSTSAERSSSGDEALFEDPAEPEASEVDFWLIELGLEAESRDFIDAVLDRHRLLKFWLEPLSLAVAKVWSCWAEVYDARNGSSNLWLELIELGAASITAF